MRGKDLARRERSDKRVAVERQENAATVWTQVGPKEAYFSSNCLGIWREADFLEIAVLLIGHAIPQNIVLCGLAATRGVG